MKKRVWLPGAFSTIPAAAFTGCGKSATLEAEPFTGKTVQPEGVSIEIVSAKADVITYTICNTSEAPLYYEGHWFAGLQGEKDGLWYPLQFAEFAATAEFLTEEVPNHPEVHTLSVMQFYGAKLKAGRYRLFAKCYPSSEALFKADPEACLCLVKEFQVK